MANFVKTKIKYEFWNSGTHYSFDPNKLVYDNLNDGSKITLLQFHFNLIKHLDSPSAFVMNNRGNVIHEDGSEEVYESHSDVKKSKKSSKRR